MCKQKKRPPKPLNETRMKDLALFYVARFSTSASKLERYLLRKLREREWEGDAPADPSALVRSFVKLGYIDDEHFARSKSNSLTRRGYGPRRVSEALGHDGIDQQIRDDVRPNEARQRHSALAMAKKRRFGPFSREILERGDDYDVDDPPPIDRAKREKHIAAMLRAGHMLDNVRQVLNAANEEAALEWAHELDEEWPDDDI